MPKSAAFTKKDHPATASAVVDMSLSHNMSNDMDDCDGYYEPQPQDLPPKQIWMLHSNSNSATATRRTPSSVVSPLRTMEHHQKKEAIITSTSKTIFSSKNLILDGHVWMGGMMKQPPQQQHHHHNSHCSATTTTTNPPALCTPDSTQTDNTQAEEEEDDEPHTTLGIGAAPYYGTRNHHPFTNSSSGSHEEDIGSSTPTHSSFSSPHRHCRREHQVSPDHEEDDDLSSSIPSFSTRRIILDLQDELARTKAELAHYKKHNNTIIHVQDNSNETTTTTTNDTKHDVPCIMDQPNVKKDNDSGKDTTKEDLDEEDIQEEQDDSSVDAVVLAVPKKTYTSTNGAALLHVRLNRSEQRVVRLSAKLKETNDLARRLSGTLQRVKDRMQKETLPYEYFVQDVQCMKTCGHFLILTFIIGGPMTLCYLQDITAFALVIAITFSAVEIAIRP